VEALNSVLLKCRSGLASGHAVAEELVHLPRHQ
jgi:hypothetical protein